MEICLKSESRISCVVGGLVWLVPEVRLVVRRSLQRQGHNIHIRAGAGLSYTSSALQGFDKICDRAVTTHVSWVCYIRVILAETSKGGESPPGLLSLRRKRWLKPATPWSSRERFTSRQSWGKVAIIMSFGSMFRWDFVVRVALKLWLWLPLRVGLTQRWVSMDHPCLLYSGYCMTIQRFGSRGNSFDLYNMIPNITIFNITNSMILRRRDCTFKLQKK